MHSSFLSVILFSISLQILDYLLSLSFRIRLLELLAYFCPFLVILILLVFKVVNDMIVDLFHRRELRY